MATRLDSIDGDWQNVPGTTRLRSSQGDPMSAAPVPVASESIADVLARLGDIPPERLRIPPLPGLATEADLLAALEAPRKRICELIDGTLVEKAMGFRESLLAGRLLVLLDLFVSARNLGLLTGPDGMLQLFVGRVRAPDIAFIPWVNLPDRRVPQEPIPAVAPDLAIEILSESNTPGEMRLKREDYFHAGTRLVWEIDPRRRTITIYTRVDPADSVLTAADTLTGDPVLPGFTLPLAPFFNELDRHG
jgi:Uma2 family endonuclease